MMKQIISAAFLGMFLAIAALAVADGGPAPNCMPCPDGHGGRTWCCAR